MVIVKIVSGPQQGQQNLVPMVPEQLSVLSQHGWRWQIEWDTVPQADQFDWVKHDLVNKVVAALIRGGYVRFAKPEGTDEWSGPISAELMAQIDDALGYSGYNLFVSEDVDDGVTIAVHSQETKTQ